MPIFLNENEAIKVFMKEYIYIRPSSIRPNSYKFGITAFYLPDNFNEIKIYELIIKELITMIRTLKGMKSEKGF